MTQLSNKDKSVFSGGDSVNDDTPKASDAPDTSTPTQTETTSTTPRKPDDGTLDQGTPDDDTVQLVLKDEDLSSEELRTVQLKTTAFSRALYANKDLLEAIVENSVRRVIRDEADIMEGFEETIVNALHRANREGIAEIGEPPEPYHETNSALELFMTELVPIGIMVALLGVFVALLTLSGVHGWGLFWLIVGGLVALAVNAYFVGRTYKLWATTFRISDHEKLGFEREENGFFLISGYNPTVPAADYKKGNQWRSQILRGLHINAWHADLDSFSQDDDFLHKQKYVKDADRYKATAEANKDYALKIQRG